MPVFDPDTLAGWTGGRWAQAPQSRIEGFTMDTRALKPGQMFVALKTSQRDGHDFLGAAEQAQAAAALVSKPNPSLKLAQLVVDDPLVAFQAIAREHRRKFRGPVVGVTGSAGKTSTKNLLALILGSGPGGPGASAQALADRLPSVVATEGNLNNHIGVPLTLTRLDPAAGGYAVVEAGISAPGEMAVLAAMIEPDVAIVTLVGPAHLAELGGLEGVAREKSVLAAAVRPGGVAIFPSSCTAYAAFRDLQVKKIAIGTGPAGPGFVSLSLHQGANETELSLQGEAFSQAERFRFRRVTDGMAQNAALAIEAAAHLGVATETIRTRLLSWQSAPLRGEVRRDKERLLYLDCYNANPASMADAVSAFVGIAPAFSPRLFVIGGMEELGPEAARFHRELGRRLPLRTQDHVLAIGDHAAALREGAIERGSKPEQIEVATPERIRSAVASFQGSIFVKGSRKYELEKLISVDAPSAH